MTSYKQTQAKPQDTVESAAPHPAKQEVFDLGPEASFVNRLPARISLRNISYYLVRGKAGSYQLLSTVCPHQGGEVVNVGSCFECPQHGWRFEHATGKSINAPNQRLSSIAVTALGAPV